MTENVLKILLLEDEPAHVEAIMRSFRSCNENFALSAAGSLSEYLKMIADHEPDIAIMDMNLPDGSAFDLLGGPIENSAFPVIVMTSYGNEEVAVNAMKAGAIEYVVKSPEAFMAMPKTVASVMREWKLIQERKALEKKMMDVQKLESLGVLAGGIAHDFNNLLMAILGHADLALTRMDETSPGREHILEIGVATRRAAELCRQMLAYSGKGKFVVEHIDLQHIIEEMAHMLKTSISKKAQLILNLHAGLPLTRGDATQLRQVLMNLVINASEVLEGHTGLIEITTGELNVSEAVKSGVAHVDDLPPGRYVFIEVTDTGCGMSDEVQKKIFDPFFTTKFTGRGLGMSAVLGIIKGHSGTLQIKSRPGEGTRFRVVLPACEDLIVPKTVEVQAENRDWRGSGTILLVDDEETLLLLGKMMLESLGFKVLQACDGWEAVQVFRQHRDEIGCVLLDLTMPHMDGVEAFSELRKIDSQAKIVLASGFTEHEIEARFADKSPSGFLQKPYGFDSLRHTLAKIFK